MSAWFDTVSSLKVKLGILVAASVVTAVLLSLLGSAARVPALLVLPVSVALALGVTQLLAAGMVAPLRRMTEVSRAMARGDYSGRVRTTATDEVGQLAAAFNRMAEDLATVDRERRDLIATVSHELRTPLTAMTALLENLADGVVPADPDHLGDALDEARRLGRLVEDLLQLSRLEAGVVELDRQDVALRALVEDSVAQVLAAGRPGTITLDIPDGLLVVADPARMRQLLVNVLDNAARHAPAGTSVRVTGGAGTASTASWWLEVADDGGGVAPEDRERVFDRFGTDGAGGTGLGLAVARWVAQLHGGTLRFLDPATGAGARLRLEVPRGHPAHQPLPRRPGSPPGARPAGGRAAGADGTRTPAARSRRPVRPLLARARVPSGFRTVVAAAAAGLFAGFALSFNAVGITWTLVAIGCGVAALLTARGRTRPLDPGLCRPGAAAGAADDPPRRVVGPDARPPRGHCSLPQRGHRRAHPGRHPSSPASPGRWHRSAGSRGSAGRCASQAPARGRRRSCGRPRGPCWASVSSAHLRQRQPGVRVVGRPAGPQPHLQRPRRARLPRGFVFAATLGAAYLALNPADVEVLGGRRPPALANRFEWLVPVLVVDAVFLAFIAAQARRTRRRSRLHRGTTGLTYADFVHQGFGQLTLATALTVLVVWVAVPPRREHPGGPPLAARLPRRPLRADPARRRLGAARDGGLPGRVRLHDPAAVRRRLRGLARASWCSRSWSPGRRAGRWLPRIALVSGAVALIGLAAINPDAWVAERNLDRYEATGKLDVRYLQSLSADAAPGHRRPAAGGRARCVLQDLP